MSLQVLPYDPAWARLFSQQLTAFEPLLAATAGQLEHIGSTAVPGLAARAEIDMLLLVESSDELLEQLPLLTALGYQPVACEQASLRFEKASTQHCYQLYIANTLDKHSYLSWRDYLIAHPQIAAEFSWFKRDSAYAGFERYSKAKLAFMQRCELPLANWLQQQDTEKSPGSKA